jgi:non-catalytic primase subunit PriX-like protein
MGHFKGQERYFPRTISTKATQGRQILIDGPGEAMDRYEEANFMDCRISAYPPPSATSSFVGVNLDIAPSIIMIDLDWETFKTQKAFEMALSRTLDNIRKFVNSNPTVIWSGSGYHIYLVLDAFPLESVDLFNNDRFGTKASQKFLRYAEAYLSNGKCDPQHNNTVSLRNCMLRIPGSINSKNGEPVRVIQKWNGSRPNIRYLLEGFYVHLCGQRIEELQSRSTHQKINSNSERRIPVAGNRIEWIENLLRTPITDHRKFSIWRILVPYLLKIRGLSQEQTHTIILEWLEECGRIQRLEFNPSSRIKGALNSSKNFLPISMNKLKVENEGLYHLLQNNGVLTK